MIYAILVCGVAIISTLLILLTKKFPAKTSLILRIFAYIFIAAYVVRLVHNDAFDRIYGGLSDYMSTSMIAMMMGLRALTMISAIVTCIEPIRSSKTCKDILSLFVPIVTILNIIFFRQHIIAFAGTTNINYVSIRAIQFAIETMLMGGISAYYLYGFVTNWKERRSSFRLGSFFAVLGFLLLACFPVGIFQGLFGEFGDEATGFTFTHRVMLYLTCIIPIVIYFAYRNKGVDRARTMLIYLSTACLVLFTYTININNLSYTNLPLHLCNTGVFLIFIAYVFNVKSIYYFTFFVNVIGALFAMVLPDTDGSVFLLSNIRFWVDHMYVFFLPILGMVLKVFPRPNFKMIRGAIYVFSIYFVAMIIANAWINTFASVDYFFLQGDTVSKHADFLYNWQQLYKLSVTINGITYTTAWVYDIFIYFGYILLMFIIWIFYDAIFKTQDHYTRLIELQKSDMLDIRELRKKIGNDITKPINPRGKNMIKISHFTKIYAGSDRKAVDDFSLTVKAGQVFGFIGHNGAGKSTLIKSLVGIQSITSGSIEVCGYDITKQPLQAKLNIGYVSDNHAVYEKLTGREYINYVADLYLVSKEDREARLARYAKMFHLENDLDREIKGYSHGMKQKLVVIASIIHNPKVWVLDEPLTGLDPISSFQIKSLMREMADAGHIVFFSSHVIEVLEKLCDRVAIIKQGHLVGEYTSDQLKTKKMSLEDIYLDVADEAVTSDVKNTIVTGTTNSK